MSSIDTASMTAAQEAAVEDFQAELKRLRASVTQREWLIITTRLDRSRDQIEADGALNMLALAWVKGVREHGGAKWDDLLDLTDDQLLAAHGWPAHLFDDAPAADTHTPQED